MLGATHIHICFLTIIVYICRSTQVVLSTLHIGMCILKTVFTPRPVGHRESLCLTPWYALKATLPKKLGGYLFVRHCNLLNVSGKKKTLVIS